MGSEKKPGASLETFTKSLQGAVLEATSEMTTGEGSLFIVSFAEDMNRAISFSRESKSGNATRVFEILVDAENKYDQSLAPKSDTPTMMRQCNWDRKCNWNRMGNS
jgi:hypothetical protein